MTSDNANLRLDYEQTTQMFRQLADIRFKLIAFVPALSGTAVALLTGEVAAQTQLALGLLGLTVVLGIVLYDLRNTEMYNAAIHRAKSLERDLHLATVSRQWDREKKTWRQPPSGGLFSERPVIRTMLYGIFTVKHDRALGLVYGASIGGWAYIAADAILTLVADDDYAVPILVATFVAAASVWEFRRIDAGWTLPPAEEYGSVAARD